MPSPDRRDALLEQAKARHWFHQIRLTEDFVTPGKDRSAAKLANLDSLGLPRDLSGKRVLDIGAWDGFFAFELERRGAAEVLALDHVDQSATGFPLAAEILGSRVEWRTRNIYHLDPDDLGHFDLVLCLGVIYHLRHVLLGLDRVRGLMKPGADLFVETAALENHVMRGDGSFGSLADAGRPGRGPLLQLYAGSELRGDPTNFFVPNLAGLASLLRAAEFEMVKAVTAPEGFPYRAIAWARAVSDPQTAFYRQRDEATLQSRLLFQAGEESRARTGTGMTGEQGVKRSIRIGEQTHEVSSDDAYLANMGPEFEPTMVALFRAVVAPEMVVADIGANIGMTSLLFSALAAKVYAFEPAPSTYEFLLSNLRAAGAKNVEAYNVGLGEAKEELKITFSRNNRSGGFVSQHIRPEQGHVTERIEIETLDGFFADRSPKPDFIKIDVEGFEPHVIRGGRSILAEREPTVVLELNHFCLNVLQRIALPDFFDQLRDAFPRLYAVDTDNRSIADLHHADSAYAVMHAHVTSFRFPSIVAGFDPVIGHRLAALRAQAGNAQG